MNEWQQIKINEDPDWQEHIKSTMHHQLGRSTLKIFRHSSSAIWSYAIRADVGGAGGHGPIYGSTDMSIDQVKQKAIELISRDWREKSRN